MKLPTTWQIKRLEKLVQFSSGGTPSKSKPEFWQGNIPWISAATMHQQEIVTSELLISEDGLKAGSKLAKENDLLLLVRGSMLWKKVPICICKRNVAFNQDVKALSVNGKVTPTYLLYWFLAHQRFLLNKVVGTGIGAGKFDLDELKALNILLPPLSEQKTITDLLSTWDEAIEKTERLIVLKEKHQFVMMQRLLTKQVRLNGFKGEWQEFRLGNLFQERKERGFSDLPLLSITRQRGVIPQDSNGRRDTSCEDKSRYLRICKGDIGYNTMRMWQGVSALSDVEGVVSPAYTICIPNPEVDGLFMAYLFKLPKIIHLFYRYSQGLTSDTWNLKFRHFSEIKVTIPEVDEQRAIAKLLNAVDLEKDLLKRQKDLLMKQKRGLMQKLLTGKWRVNSRLEAI